MIVIMMMRISLSSVNGSVPLFSVARLISYESLILKLIPRVCVRACVRECVCACVCVRVSTWWKGSFLMFLLASGSSKGNTTE